MIVTYDPSIATWLKFTKPSQAGYVVSFEFGSLALELDLALDEAGFQVRQLRDGIGEGLPELAARKDSWPAVESLGELDEDGVKAGMERSDMDRSEATYPAGCDRRGASICTESAPVEKDSMLGMMIDPEVSGGGFAIAGFEAADGGFVVLEVIG